MIKNEIHGIPDFLDALTGEISRRITDKYRLEHTFSVARECLALAEIFSFDKADKMRILISALLHDIVKGLSVEQYTSLDEKYSIGFTAHDLECPAVLHAKAGAKIAEYEFLDYVDDEICTAIAQHTTGAENMSIIAKLLFIADYIEPTRKWDICRRTRESFYSDLTKDRADIYRVLDGVIIKILLQTEAHLAENGRKVHPDAIKCKDFILKTIE